MANYELNDVLQTFGRDGIVVLHDLFDADRVRALRAEGEALRDRFHDKYGATSPVKTRGGWRLDIPPVNLVRSGGAPMAREVGRAFSHPLIQDATNAILGDDWNVGALVFDYREPTDEPLPDVEFEKGYPPAYLWHADQGKPGLSDPSVFTLRFQIYLNDTDFERGAMGYARGSHKLVRYLRRRFFEIGMGDVNEAYVDTHEALVAGYERLVQSGADISDDARAAFEKYIAEVPDWTHADAKTACAGGAGTVLMFDDTGMHRGNMVNTDHRYVYRYLCVPASLGKRVRNFGTIKNTLARTYYKKTLNEPLTALL